MRHMFLLEKFCFSEAMASVYYDKLTVECFSLVGEHSKSVKLYLLVESFFTVEYSFLIFFLGVLSLLVFYREFFGTAFQLVSS